jgi:hypothetical protein
MKKKNLFNGSTFLFQNLPEAELVIELSAFYANLFHPFVFTTETVPRVMNPVLNPTALTSGSIVVLSSP